MGDIEKLLQSSARRKEEISDLISLHFPDCDGNEKLLEAAKEMDELMLKVHKEQAALERCSIQLSQSSKPWEINVKQLFNEEINKSHKEKNKQKKGFYHNLQSHMNKQKDEDVMVVSNEQVQAIDPWTRLPIKNPVRAPVCKHVYDKRSITCLTRKQPEFRCPYVGCRTVVQIKDLIGMDDD